MSEATDRLLETGNSIIQQIQAKSPEALAAWAKVGAIEQAGWVIWGTFLLIIARFFFARARAIPKADQYGKFQDNDLPLVGNWGTTVVCGVAGGWCVISGIVETIKLLVSPLGVLMQHIVK